MGLEVGAVVEGKVTGITKFGAFVALPEGRSGLVHISEVANTYVNEVGDYLTVGQTVKVRVLSIAKDGKINLSVRQAAENPAAPRRDAPPRQSRQPHQSAPARGDVQLPDPPSADRAFEDRLKKFMQESDSRIAGSRMYADRGARRRRK